MAGLLLLALGGAQAAARELAGGWSEAPASAKITALAQYSLRSLAEEFCASSNAFGCSRLQGATFVSVTSAHTQVVAGTNYEIEMSTSAGPLTIRVYEQLWTGTLTVTSASVRNAGNRLGVYAVLQDGEEHAMDAADFEEFRQALAAPVSGSPLLVGGALGGGGGAHFSGLLAQAAPAAETAAPSGVCAGCPVDQPAAELAAGSKAHRLAGFALAQLLAQSCYGSNSLGCARLQGASLVRIASYRTQVVSGTNHLVDVETTAGLLHFKFYEQSWTSTLILTGASLGDDLAILHEGEELSLDSSAFAAFSAPPFADAGDSDAGAAPLLGGGGHGQQALLGEGGHGQLVMTTAAPAAGGLLGEGGHGQLVMGGTKELVYHAGSCEGGKVWNECATQCEPTCEAPHPMCIQTCAAKCACPKAAPIWHEGACVTAAACPTAPHFDPPTLTAVGPRENALEAAAPAERTPSAAGIVIVLVVVAALAVLVMVRRRGGRAPQGGLSAMDGAKDLQGV